jgi:Protein of unknown function (DUF3142)
VPGVVTVVRVVGTRLTLDCLLGPTSSPMTLHPAKAIDAFMRIPKLQRGILSVLFFAAMALAVWSATPIPRVCLPDEVPVAFWSWRLESPTQEDVNEAVKQTGTNVLFVRAGQIDYEKEKLNCIRRVTGRIPANINVHLAYNATRSLLTEFPQLSNDDMSGIVLAVFGQDLARTRIDQAQIVGLQLDFDIPTRLLSKYALLLRNIRRGLPHEIQLSITGLPTWMESTVLREALSPCDFWIPQCYGAQIPDKLGSRIPISSPENVSRFISRARDLGAPFYAGLAAYGYAIHYSCEGLLIELRGDLDPTLVAGSAAFEVSDQIPFKIRTKGSPELQPAEWRRIYRALRDVILDGTAIRSGEAILVQRPTAVGLRACAAKVREQGGESLLGICVFRMPTSGDSNTLTLSEIVSALKDAEPRFLMHARADQFSVGNVNKTSVRAVVELTNAGTATIRSDDGVGMIVRVRLPAGCLDSVSISGLATAQPVFVSGDQIVNCSIARANAVKFMLAWWPPGATFTARFQIKQPLDNVEIRYTGMLENGSLLEGSDVLPMW